MRADGYRVQEVEDSFLLFSGAFFRLGLYLGFVLFFWGNESLGGQ